MMSKVEREQLEKVTGERDAARVELATSRTRLQGEIDDLKKQLDNSKSSADMYSRSAAKAEQELEAAHALLDGLPQAPPTETDGKESWQRKNLPVTTRLASWIAKVAFSEAFAKIGIK